MRRLNLLVAHCASRGSGTTAGALWNGFFAAVLAALPVPFLLCLPHLDGWFSPRTSGGRQGAGRPVAASRCAPLAGFWPPRGAALRERAGLE